MRELIERFYDERVHHAAHPTDRIGAAAPAAEVDLHLPVRRAIGNTHGLAFAAKAQLADGEGVQRAIRDDHPATAQQRVRLRQRQALLQPRRELFALPGERLPRRGRTARPGRSDPAGAGSDSVGLEDQFDAWMTNDHGSPFPTTRS